MLHPGWTTLDDQLDDGLDGGRIVEGEHRQVDPVTAPLEGQGRAAPGAESAPDLVGTLESRALSARPGQGGTSTVTSAPNGPPNAF